jgi:hypothetical protein
VRRAGAAGPQIELPLNQGVAPCRLAANLQRNLAALAVEQPLYVMGVDARIHVSP